MPGQATGRWRSSQIRVVFDLIDEVVTGRVRPQLAQAVASRPIELLLGLQGDGWPAVEAFRASRVSYGTLLAQRDVGSAWGAHRNRTNNEMSRLLVERLLAALDEAGVGYWSTDGAKAVPSKFLAGKAVKEGKTPGQLSVVTRDATGDPRYAVLIAVARDGGTARRSAATVLKLRRHLVLPGVAVLLLATGVRDPQIRPGAWSSTRSCRSRRVAHRERAGALRAGRRSHQRRARPDGITSSTTARTTETGLSGTVPRCGRVAAFDRAESRTRSAHRCVALGQHHARHGSSGYRTDDLAVSARQCGW